MQIHVTLQKVHQVILEATVGGQAGDIAIDDISLISGPCPASGNKTENHRKLGGLLDCDFLVLFQLFLK